MNLLHRYLRDSLWAYRACADALGVAGGDTDLSVLLQAARKGAVGRRGELAVDDGVRLRYHVHGAGYSITELATGKETHFDVGTVGGAQCLRFGMHGLQRYAASIGEEATRAAIRAELGKPHAAGSGLIHVTEGSSDYYCYAIPVPELIAGER